MAKQVALHNRNLGRNDDRAAGRTPAVLPDELCGPVKVRHKYIQGKRPWCETLTMMLQTLREHADATGYADGKSVLQVLMSIDGVTKAVATRAMVYLNGLEFYTTAMTGMGVSSYQLDTARTVVTAEMVRELRQSRNKKARESRATVTISNSANVTLASVDSSEDDLLAQAADTIEGLEAELDAAKARIVALESELRESRVDAASRERLAGVLRRRTVPA